MYVRLFLLENIISLKDLSAFLGRVSDNKYWFFILSLALGIFTVLISIVNQSFGFVFISLLLFIGIIVIVWIYPISAVLINILFVYLGFFLFGRVLSLDIPGGVIVDALHFFALFTLLMKGQLAGFKTPVGIYMVVWLGFIFLQAANPNSPSLQFWFLGLRGYIGLFAPFFIVYSHLRGNENRLNRILNVWLAFGVIAALYTIYQELFGFPAFEMRRILSNEKAFNLLYTFGRLRKMGTFQSPTEAGVILPINAIIALGFLLSKGISSYRKLVYLFIFFVSSWAMMYTGSRTATLLWVFGIVFYTILTRNRILILGSVVCFFLIGPVLFVSGKGGAAMRVMFTAFNSEDPSLKVRFNSQKQIRALILRAPIGYGVGRDTNDITEIQPDSEYVGKAIRIGYVGLILWLILQFIMVNNGLISLNNRDGEDSLNLKKAILCVGVVIVIAHYPQNLGYPTFKIIYMVCMAVLSLRVKQPELNT